MADNKKTYLGKTGAPVTEALYPKAKKQGKTTVKRGNDLRVKNGK